MNTIYPPKIVRKKDVLALTGLSKSTLYNRINDNLFCPSISLGPRAVGFIYKEVEAVTNAMMAELSPDEIRQLVSKLISERRSLKKNFSRL